MIDRAAMSDQALVTEAAEALEDLGKAMLDHRAADVGMARERYNSANRERCRRNIERRKAAIAAQGWQPDLFGMEP